MSRLAARLARMHGPGAAPEAPTDRTLELLPSHLDRLRPWRFEVTDFGSARSTREIIALSRDLPEVDLASLLGDPRLAGFRFDEALYLDIETTGLGHGAGTLAFLVGLAWIEGDHVVLDQLFLTDPTEEMALLRAFLDRLERCRYLVSFNGKSFDTSVLQSRLVITRLLGQVEAQLKLVPHFDLFHVSRRAYKGLLPDGKLQTLERAVLGLDPFERHVVVPGALVPTLYFHYLHTGEAPPLHGVLVHNRVDVLSLVSLAMHLCDVWAGPPEDAPDGVVLNLVRDALKRRDRPRAEALLARCSSSSEAEVALAAQALSERLRRMRWPKPK